MEQFREKRGKLYMVLIDLKKAYDGVPNANAVYLMYIEEKHDLKWL